MKREVERHTTKFGTSGGSGKANKLQTVEQWNLYYRHFLDKNK